MVIIRIKAGPISLTGQNMTTKMFLVLKLINGSNRQRHGSR
jgi:hypothetical protein